MKNIQPSLCVYDIESSVYEISIQYTFNSSGLVGQLWTPVQCKVGWTNRKQVNMFAGNDFHNNIKSIIFFMETLNIIWCLQIRITRIT